tara:strand:- start:305 stop:472 length:168 start_codon:yes stop_codon:yes gene_type:complete
MEIISHQGTSLESIGREIIGMLALIIIAYALSDNRKNISWKVVCIGLITQLIIAI